MSLTKIAILVSLALPSVARADPPDRATCASAYEQGQRLRKQNALVESRAQLVVCGRDPCPESLQPDCVRWLGEVEHLVPSIVVAARKDDGSDVKDARVLVDGRLVAERLDGNAIEVNPGDHTVRVEIGTDVLEQSILTNAAEKARIVTFKVRDRLPPPPPRPPPPPPPPPPPVVTERPIGWPTYVLSGIGVVGLGLFGGFAIRGESQYGDLKNCRPACDPDDVSATRVSYRVSDVALGVGILAVAGAVITYITRPTIVVR